MRRRLLPALLLLASCGDPSGALDASDTGGGPDTPGPSDTAAADADAAAPGDADPTDAPDTAAPDGSLPTPLALGACELLGSGTLQVDFESSGVAPLPGLTSPTGLPLLVTHGDTGLLVVVVDTAGHAYATVQVRDKGDFEGIALTGTGGSATVQRFDFVALRSPGNECTRGDGVCAKGQLVTFSLHHKTGSWAMPEEPVAWDFPEKELTNAEAVFPDGNSMLLFAKNTADKYRVHLTPGAETALFEPLVKDEKTGAQGRLTDLAREPGGRLFATSTTENGYVLVEFDTSTWKVRHVTPMPASVSGEKVEGLTFLPDGTVVLTTEQATIEHRRCNQ
jgi:hypothetical protein